MTGRGDGGHGYGAYTNGCRCDVCRAAKAEYMRERRAAGRAKAQMHTRSSTGGRPAKETARAVGAVRYVAPLRRHGTRAGSDESGCRCFRCTDARLAANRRYRATP